ncbi:MAG: 50S ribosomal protein L6 [Planctomycetota bacterium]|nr:MAG: 50S ribosomal protein L6 [Planctomycetota bacterium]
MSRIGKQPVEVPSKVKVTIGDGAVTAESGGKTLSVAVRPEIAVRWDESEKRLLVAPAAGLENDRQARALWGTTRALIQNMITGLTAGYQKKLEVNGVGWTAAVAGPELELKVGYANAIRVPIPPGLSVAVERNIITVTGADKQAVGEFAATVRAKRKPEPYKGKGVKYLDEVIRRKSGKKFGA